MTDFDRWAAPRIMQHEARKCRQCDAAMDVLMAMVVGILGALALVHWWAS